MFHTFGYRGGTIHVSAPDHGRPGHGRERIEYQLPDDYSVRQARSVHAAKVAITRHLKARQAND